MSADATHRAILAVWRNEHPRLITSLARMLRDVPLAEEVTQDALVAALEKAGIGSLIHYPIPPHLQQAYADLGQGAGTYPLAERLAETVLSLPIGPHLPVESVDEIAAVVRAALT